MQEHKVETVGIKEFRANLHKYTSGFSHPILITSHGHNIGFYIPIRKANPEKNIEALREASKQFTDMLAANGITPDQFMEEFKASRAAEKAHRE